MLSDFQKQYFNNGISNPSTYFWRDKNGRIEVDCIVDRGDALFPVEIKSGETIAPSFFSQLAAWNELAKCPPDRSTIIYGGNSQQTRTNGRVIGWKRASQFISRLEKR
jgi:predicted AAA+ superfamily ATPase